MIIVSYRGNFIYHNSKIYSLYKNNFVESIEFNDNEFNETLLREKSGYYVKYFNYKKNYHNPIGPAVLIYYDNGAIKIKEYWKNGKYHRLDGPAIEIFFENGLISSKSYLIENLLHRKNGPAIISYNSDGSLNYKKYYKHDELHRLDGPAYIKYDKNGTIKDEEYWIQGMCFSKEEFDEVVNVYK